ncbi:MAG TPA: TIR domain-containing protein [Bacteroidia bacterium]|jgi:hypothetical protein|nr:TIR domain-containing protein [Bacteroidia bacterium]
MSKTLFVSTVFEDSKKIESIQKWAKEKRLGDLAITSETKDKRSIGKEAIKQHISDKIRGCSAVAVLVGKDTHNHDWIEAEVELANSFHKPIICMRLPNTTGAVPSILKNHDTINFDPDSLKRALKR